MPMRPPTLRFHAALALVLTVALVTAGPAIADRPSLLELQAALDGLVAPPPPAAVGTLVFAPGSIAGESTFELVSLGTGTDVSISCPPLPCVPSGGAQASIVWATIVETANGPFSGQSGGRTSSGTGPRKPVLRFITHRRTKRSTQSSGMSRVIMLASCQMSFCLAPPP